MAGVGIVGRYVCGTQYLFQARHILTVSLPLLRVLSLPLLNQLSFMGYLM
jgi:hypothetical protein